MQRDDCDARYVISIDPKKLEISVKLHLSGKAVSDGMTLTVPSWVPGDYEFEPYGRDLFQISASDPDTDESVEIFRDGWNGYRLTGVRDRVDICYTACAYTPDLGDAMGLVDSNYAILLATRYLFNPDYLGDCEVHYVNLPDGWDIHHPSGAQRLGDATAWRYPSFEILLDTPVVLGNPTVHTRTIKSVPFHFVFVDQAVGFDQKVVEFLDLVEAAIKAIHDIFGLFPFEDYTFILSQNPQADWGLEHLTSNMSGLGPDVYVDPAAFAAGVRVCAHELFHAWNVRRLRPAPLGQLSKQLTCGCFTEGLWMAEGFTRYYEFLVSTRAGAYDPDHFFSAVFGYWQHLSRQPAFGRVSAVDSSYASYLNHAKYPGRVNNSIDYYDKGMLIAFALDSRLRRIRSGASLDAAFRDFYLEFFGQGQTLPPEYLGYTTTQVIDFFNGVEGGLGDTLGNWLKYPAGIDTVADLVALGLEPVVEESHAIGVFFLNDGAPEIYGVADDMPASVGLAPGDVITAVNGFAYTRAAMDWAAASPAPLTLSVRRGHRLLEFTMTPQPHGRVTGLRWTGTGEQAELIADWLGRDFSPTQGQVFAVTFYENFHGVEAMI
ncbi:hypothetical protein [Primorskyibacter sp. 2E233]|uniref:M61 family metallopeptidase n=1 Tax=Primorskyibacter sp. 2E233 TaxID=3413431 RepID=UPI003BF45248